MNLMLNIPDDLAARLIAGGANPEHLALAALNDAADQLARGAAPVRLTPAEAAARIRERRKGTTLGCLTIKELVSEGRP